LQIRQVPDNNLAIRSIHFVSKSEGWAVGSDKGKKNSNYDEQGIALHTTDGGRHWQFAQIRKDEPFYDRVHFTDAQSGWLFARDNVYHTNDGGVSWNIILKFPPIVKLIDG